MNNSPTTKEELEEMHERGLAGILKIHGWKQFSKKPPFIVTVICTLLISTTYLLTPKSSYDVLTFVVQTGLAILPNLLGFSLGGFVLIIGFGNSDLIKSMTKKLKNENGSLFQKVSAIFAFALLLQVVSLIASFFINLLLNLQLDLLPYGTITEKFYSSINTIVLIVLSFFYFWTLFILPYIVTNIFTFGQSYHLYLSVLRIASTHVNSNVMQGVLEFEKFANDELVRLKPEADINLVPGTLAYVHSYLLSYTNRLKELNDSLVKKANETLAKGDPKPTKDELVSICHQKVREFISSYKPQN